MAISKQTSSHRSPYLRGLITLVLIVGILYLAKAVIVPLALAVLLTFILTPLVVAVQRRGLSRVPAVLIVVLFTLVLFAVIGWSAGFQVSKLAKDLPTHSERVKAKIDKLRNSVGGPISRAMKSFEGIGDKPVAAPAPPWREANEPVKPEPRIVAAVPEQTFFERMMTVATAVLEPVATAGLILILVIFMLIRREDLRNRVIGLLGHTRLAGTTRVIVDSAQRLSRLLLTQLAVNAAFGLLFGIALLIIGVPYWLLWGFLTVLLRFVPYVGSWLAAAFPVLLSFAVSDGWLQPFIVLAVFAVLDLTTANVVEPILFGHSTGVSPVALLVAAVFWTWVWGPIGLVLSTPLTLCLVVLGQHVPRLRFLSLLLGDQPALDPHVSYYQRLLAGDKDEARSIARAYALAEGHERLADSVFVPALRLARRDRKHAGLTVEDEAAIFETTESILDDLQKSPPVAKGAEKTDPAEVIAAPITPVVLGCPAHHRADELPLRMLAGILARAGRGMEVISTRVLPVEIEAHIERENPAVVFISVVPPGGIVQARYLCKRLRKRFPDLRIVVGYWGRARDFDKLLVTLRSAGASYVTTSIAQSASQVLALTTATPQNETNVSETAASAVTL